MSTELEPAAQDEPRYLVFAIGVESYALPLGSIANVLPEGPITRVPGASPYVRGVSNVRGSLLAVVDLPAILGIERSSAGQGHVLVVRSSLGQVGLVVDWAREILPISPDRVEPRLSTLAEQRATYLDGQVRHASELIGLVRLEQVVQAARNG